MAIFGRASSAGSIFCDGKLKKPLIASKTTWEKKKPGQKAKMLYKFRLTASASFITLFKH